MATGIARDKRANAHPGRVDLKTNEIDQLVEDQGVYVKITPAIVCPNRTSVTDTNHPAQCPVCGGNSALDLSAHAVFDWALLQNIDKELMFNVPGMFNLKDAKLTMKAAALIKLDYWYKIEVQDHTSVFNELVRRSGDTTKPDKLRYPSAQSIEKLQCTFAMDNTGVEYQNGSDFIISGQTLTWNPSFPGATPVGPAPGAVYSITYPILPTFRVIEFLNADRYYYISAKQPMKTATDLPQQVAIRWDYLAAQKGVNEPLPT